MRAEKTGEEEAPLAAPCWLGSLQGEVAWSAWALSRDPLEREPRAVVAHAPQTWARWVCQERAPDGRGKLRKEKHRVAALLAQKRLEVFCIYLLSFLFLKKNALVVTWPLFLERVCTAVCLPSPFALVKVMASPGPVPWL